MFICCNRILTAVVTHGATGALVVNWSTAIDVKSTFLHQTGGTILNAITELTWFVGIRRNLSTFQIEFTINTATEFLGNTQFIAWFRGGMRNIYRNCGEARENNHHQYQHIITVSNMKMK